MYIGFILCNMPNISLKEETKQLFDKLMNEEIAKRSEKLSKIDFINLMREGKRVLTADDFVLILLKSYQSHQ